jgi:hypothetical protein
MGTALFYRGTAWLKIISLAESGFICIGIVQFVRTGIEGKEWKSLLNPKLTVRKGKKKERQGMNADSKDYPGSLGVMGSIRLSSTKILKNWS